MTFANWPNELHNDLDQQKRIKSAKKPELTPLSIDKTFCTGNFSGSSGRYVTSLDNCQCGDYMKRRKPCKHMYRLAMELGLYPSDGMKQDAKAILEPKPTPTERSEILKDVIAFIESTNEDAQLELETLLRCDYQQEPYLCVDVRPLNSFVEKGYIQDEKDYLFFIKHNTQKATLDRLSEVNYKFPDNIMKKKDKYQWCLNHSDEVGPLAYPYFGTLHPSGDLQLVKRKVYTYLLRKYRDDSVFIDDGNGILSIPHGSDYYTIFHEDGSSSIILRFPDDEITKLLNQYDCNRCNSLENEKQSDTPLHGLTFVVSGTISGYTREQIAAAISEAGGRFATSVSAKTDYLVSEEKTGLKYQKAIDLGIPVIDINTLIEMIHKNKHR